MRIVSLTLSTILVTAIIATNSAAKQPTVVYPTGVFPADVQNVQAAINQGGTVLLKATDSVGHPLAFNFGTPQHLLPLRAVMIQNDVSITGEVIGVNRTTINGGSIPFRVIGGKNSIQGIKFDGPLTRAIAIVASSGTSVVGNEIQNVVPDLLVFPGFSFTLADGVDVFPETSQPSDISGNLVISSNTFGDLTGNFSIGVQVDTVTANVTISNNTLQLGQSAADAGFANSAGIACIRCHSVVTISHNMITIGPGVVFSGIVTVGDSDARYHVSRNTINSQGPFTDGIDVATVLGDPSPIVSAVIENNSINLLNADIAEGSGIGLLGSVTNSTIQGNFVTGNGPTALYALGSLEPGDQVSNNRFLFNDIAQLNPSVASIFFDEQSANNLVRGQCVSVLDLGTGNDVSCPNSHSHSASASPAIAARQQMIQHALQAQAAVRASITPSRSNP